MRILSLVCLLFLAGAAPGAPPRKADSSSLRVEGETVLIVSKLPFRVVCDAPADLYFWRLPPGWKGTDTGKELTVTEAPQGAATVAVQTLRIDWEAKKTITAGHTLAVNVGVGPAPPPPPPPPDDALTLALRTAYASEVDPAKATQVRALAALYRQGATVASDPAVATWGRLFEVMTAAAQTLGVRGKVPGVQKVLAAEHSRLLPRESSAPLNQDGRVLASQTFTRAAAALEGAIRP